MLIGVLILEDDNDWYSPLNPFVYASLGPLSCALCRLAKSTHICLAGNDLGHWHVPSSREHHSSHSTSRMERDDMSRCSSSPECIGDGIERKRSGGLRVRAWVNNRVDNVIAGCSRHDDASGLYAASVDEIKRQSRHNCSVLAIWICVDYIESIYMIHQHEALHQSLLQSSPSNDFQSSLCAKRQQIESRIERHGYDPHQNVPCDTAPSDRLPYLRLDHIWDFVTLVRTYETIERHEGRTEA
jgi:hypothetical protein